MHPIRQSFKSEVPLGSCDVGQMEGHERWLVLLHSVSHYGLEIIHRSHVSVLKASISRKRRFKKKNYERKKGEIKRKGTGDHAFKLRH